MPNETPWPKTVVQESMIVVPESVAAFGNAEAPAQRMCDVPHAATMCICRRECHRMCPMMIGKLSFYLFSTLSSQFGERVLRKIILICSDRKIFASTLELCERTHACLLNFAAETSQWRCGTDWVMVPPRPIGGHQGPRLFLKRMSSFRQSGSRQLATLSLENLFPCGIPWWAVDRLVAAIQDATGVVCSEWLNANTTIGCNVRGGAGDVPFVQVERAATVGLLRVAIARRLSELPQLASLQGPSDGEEGRYNNFTTTYRSHATRSIAGALLENDLEERPGGEVDGQYEV